uniref:Protein-cysteine N-palmitoyltransferase Rasp n=1 Tax=Glossina brevipalpis TaxID=37001 RepID=A0A1A9WFE1_9MUSC
MQWQFQGNRGELVLYFSVYLIYLIYGLCVLIGSRERILNIAKFEFSTGWPILRSRRDDTNDELENFTQYISDNWHWYLLHVALSRIIRKRYDHLQSLAHALTCSFILMKTMHLVSIITFILLLSSFYMASKHESKKLVWFLSAIWMAAIHLIKNSEYFYTLGYTEYFTVIQLLSWTVLRGCSFGLQRIKMRKSCTEEDMQNLYSLKNFLGYTLYFPCLIYGPFMGYQRFKRIMPQKNDRNEWKLFLLELLRALAWWLVLQAASHYLYLHYMARDLMAVKVVDTVFGLHAIGYFMGQFFFLFYVVTYGLGIAFARYDGFHPPNKPRCIGRIHFYSDMWKYFDEGLYEFLFIHIYAELCKKHSPVLQKLFATALTFCFVFVWHGCHIFVLIWSILNFACLVGEKIFKYLISCPSYKDFANSKLKLQASGLQRLNAALATQVFIPAAFSNVFFISGQDVGEYLIKGAYINGWRNYIMLTFCSYCFFQCSQVLLQIKFLAVGMKTSRNSASGSYISTFSAGTVSVLSSIKLPH